ncbi:hypothetical protein B0T25DRAFT_195288 [Lasiosphaeria hispida]|uniref:Uncharacterized protein n=1 Tax=Lasiosphaeria hispida TaxID=260671 RepID=A0AAJ0MDX8_9PEZI|nr:hypothetical protein B0T25DRAFT_195288 [Lasiosphaeria hispida]
MATTKDSAVGISTTLETPPPNRVSRRSRSHTDPKQHPTPTTPEFNEKSFLPASNSKGSTSPNSRSNRNYPFPKNDSNGHDEAQHDGSSIPSTVMYTPRQGSLDHIERGFSALRHDSALEREKDAPKPRFSLSAITWRETGWTIVKWIWTTVCGQNDAVANWLVFVASCLGILVAISTIVGYPQLPLISKPQGDKSSPPPGMMPLFGGLGTGTPQTPPSEPRPTLTNVNVNCYYCTIMQDPEGTWRYQKGD